MHYFLVVFAVAACCPVACLAVVEQDVVVGVAFAVAVFAALRSWYFVYHRQPVVDAGFAALRFG